MEPESHVSGPGRFRSDLVAGIFKLRADALQMCKGFAQRGHARQMKRHVLEGLRRGPPFVERDCDVVVADRDTPGEFELLLQPECGFPPLRTLPRIAHRQSKMPHHAELERNPALLRPGL